MTNTTNNVPRELKPVLAMILNALDRDAADGKQARAEMAAELRALLSDQSPAGVDGLEVVGWYRMDDRKAITPYPSVCATWHKMGVKVGAAYSDSAHAIIDGLRGENERIRLNIAEYNEAISCYQSERDQQAQRIGELEGLLRACHSALHPLDNKMLEAKIDAAPAAPAADATVRQATDGGRNQSYEGLFDGETEEQRASRLAAHRAKGVV